MRVKTYTEAVRLARCVGEDAANRRVRKACRKAWSASDHKHAVRVTQSLLENLGFDIGGWTATAGIKRNEPEVPKTRRVPKGRARQTPVQLAFAFA